MSISAPSTSYVEFTPQVLQAKQTAQNLQIGVAVAAKALEVNDVQAAALLQNLQQSAQLAEGLGQNLDVRT